MKSTLFWPRQQQSTRQRPRLTRFSGRQRTTTSIITRRQAAPPTATSANLNFSSNRSLNRKSINCPFPTVFFSTHPLDADRYALGHARKNRWLQHTVTLGHLACATLQQYSVYQQDTLMRIRIGVTNIGNFQRYQPPLSSKTCWQKPENHHIAMF